MEHVGAFTQIWREICKFDDDGGRSFVTVEQVWPAGAALCSRSLARAYCLYRCVRRNGRRRLLRLRLAFARGCSGWLAP